MRFALFGAVMLCGAAVAQTTGLHPVDFFPRGEDGLAIRRHVEAGNPFTVAGTRGVVLGQQEGTFETWLLPVKLLGAVLARSDRRREAEAALRRAIELDPDDPRLRMGFTRPSH